MEAEVVQMCVNMFRGGKDACGTVCWNIQYSWLLAHWVSCGCRPFLMKIVSDLCIALLLFIEQTLLLPSTF